MPPHNNSRNTIIFIVIASIMLLAYSFFVMEPQTQKRRAAQEAAAAAEATGPITAPQPSAAVFTTDRRTALGANGTQRVPIETSTLKGSLSLTGGRIDDLFLTDYRETIAADAPAVELFRPEGMRHAFFAQFGWSGPNIPGGVPGPNTPWQLTQGATLTPTTPVVLTWDNGAGLRFTRRISVDDLYVFTVTDTVANFSGQAVTITPRSGVLRQGVPSTLGRNQVLHEGAIGAFGDGESYRTEQLKYGAWSKKPSVEHESTGGWLGITDKYWLAALVPPQDEKIEARFLVEGDGSDAAHIATMDGEAHTIQPNTQITETRHLFAGAKRTDLLVGYQVSRARPRFV